MHVVARSRNEAAVRALAEFKNTQFSETIGPYRDATLTVRAVTEESHQVTVADAEEWLERHGSPREVALKHELKKLLPDLVVRQKRSSR